MIKKHSIVKLAIVVFLLAMPCKAQEKGYDQVEELIATWQLDQARELLESYGRERRPDAGYYENWGDLYGAEKNWNQALDHYKKLLKFDDTNAEYHFKVAGVYGMIALKNKLKALGIIDDVKFHFEKAAELDETHLEARWALIELYLELPGFLGGSNNKAFRIAGQLEEISPMEGMLAKGYIEEYLGNTDQARVYYTRAAKFMHAISADYPRENIHYQFGKIASKYGINKPKGFWHLEQYEQRYNPHSRIGLEWVYYHKALIRKSENRKKQAVAMLQRSLEITPGFKPALEEMEALESL